MKEKIVRPEPARIRAVKPLGGFNVQITFAVGIVKNINLKKYLYGPAFEQPRTDPNYFRQIFVDPVSETIMWPNEADIDADVLRYDLTPAGMEDDSAQRQPKKNGAKHTTEPLVAKRVYLHPRHVKLLSKIDSNLSAAIRKVVDTYPKLKD